jgi:hypothetical protein
MGYQSALNTFTPLISYDGPPELAQSHLEEALMKMDVPKEKIDYSVHEVNYGKKLILVRADDDHISDVRAALERARATRILS